MKPLVTLTLALALVLGLTSNTEAGDEFERGFKMELGAISARAAVGFGIGLVGGMVHGAPYYDYGPCCESVRIERHVIVRPPRPHWRRHHVYPRHRHHHKLHRRYYCR